VCTSCCTGDTWGLAAGELAGIGIPGVCVCGEPVGAGVALGEGITIPGVCLWPGAAAAPVGLVVFCLPAADLRLTVRFAFRFGAAFDFGFDLLIPGMTWPSCCALTAGDETMQNSTTNDQIVTWLN
jgi:hypothetical protein